MAPPSSRRAGFSKKAQFSLFTGYLLAGAAALLGAGLLALSLWQPAAFAPLRGLASDVVTPAGTGTAMVRQGSQGIFAGLIGYFNAGSQNAELRRENEIARIRLAEAEAVKAENLRLKGLLALREAESKPVATARLVGSTATSGRRHAYLGAGSMNGVKPGMPVLSERGVIGRVLETGRFSSRVLLLTDGESVLPVRRAKDNVIAFAEGRGDGLLRIRLVNLGVNPLKVGDMMVTSGAGGYYRPGIAVAIIAKITPDGGIARLVAEPAATNFVSVLPVHVAEAVTELEAPAAAPSPKPSASPSSEASSGGAAAEE
ncbi:MAG: rod shape-determining protein MreC [Erythrobacter sp.]|uniref:rod shape-determining protein MreC n=1 Tax=Erythrobacter sp. TaxID=1042 RepID=UPI0025CC7436|nr:rod shape-determining protein MreC [Erythrobacter sp.]MCM0000676.1 rod shape-determining protein MreC [Erythrobacter sp.]